MKITVTMPDAWLVHGYLAAVQRLKAAADESTSNARDLCIALFEASNWLDSIDERHSLAHDAHVQALKYVRQRTHHAWAAAVYFDRAQSEWTWYRRANLPDSDPPFEKPALEQLYVDLLAEQPVREVFERIETIVRRIAPG